MLRIVTGPFHTDLELELVEEVTQLKTADPLAPLTIVVPSASLRQRLKWLLCIERESALLDVHFLTFYQLAVRLLEERASFGSVTVCLPFFFQELVHHLLRRQPEASHWSGLRDMPGAWGALVATLRDLKDAGVDVDRVLEALDQNQVDPQPSVQLLLSLHREFLEEKARLEAYDEDDLAVLAKDRVPTSSFLARQRRMIYYGFYDLTQVQLELFQTVSRAYPTTLYFPLVKGHPAYVFAERFFERYIHGLIAKESDAVSISGHTRRSLAGLFHPTPSFSVMHESIASGPMSRIVSVSGRLDEVTVVAKDILGLVEERGYAFQDIGVVARTLSGYESVIPRVFEEQGIPFTSTMSRSLASFPFIKTVMQLLDMRESGFRRDHVIGFLSSPFVRMDALSPFGTTPRHDLWDLTTRRLGITKGLKEWGRLADFMERDLLLRDTDDEEQLGPRIPAQQVRLLWQTVGALTETLQKIPDTATWTEFTDQVEALSAQWLDSHGGLGGKNSVDSDLLNERLTAGFSVLRQVETIDPVVTLTDFAAAFRRLMEELMLPMGSAQGRGVQVLDAMEARGIPFRALFVIGLNDKVFPRHIQEDAFLRDHMRRVFEVDLGFKIPEKLAGYDEETLLFYLLCNSARDELTLLYQRADDAGRPLVPSGYLADVTRLLGEGEIAVPRRLTAKFQTTSAYRTERLTPRELSLKLLLDRRVPRRLLKEVHPAGLFIERGLRALNRQESGQGSLGPYDGITGPLDLCWDRLKTRGVSASALQHYATCPFRYYAEHVLRLEALTLPETVDQVGASDLGTLVHSILRTCLDTLRKQAYFDPASQPSIDPFIVLAQAARLEFDRFAQSHPTGYPLLWELHQEHLMGFLTEVLRDDLAELSENGWEPILFEADMTGALTIELSDLPAVFPVFGRLDRVDWSRARNAYRIIDYKFKTGGKPQTLDTNLIRGAVRGRRLQPPLYLVTADANVPTHIPKETSPATCEGAWFYYLAQQWKQPLTRVRFPGDAWTSGLRAPLTRTISQVLTGIQSGRFFLFEDRTECERCDYRLLCRKTHQPTAWRARTDHQVVKPYRDLRRADVPDNDHPSRASHVGTSKGTPALQGEPEP